MPPTTFNDLPQEAVDHIVRHIPIRERPRLRFVCRILCASLFRVGPTRFMKHLTLCPIKDAEWEYDKETSDSEYPGGPAGRPPRGFPRPRLATRRVAEPVGKEVTSKGYLYCIQSNMPRFRMPFNSLEEVDLGIFMKAHVRKVDVKLDSSMYTKTGVARFLGVFSNIEDLTIHVPYEKKYSIDWNGESIRLLRTPTRLGMFTLLLCPSPDVDYNDPDREPRPTWGPSRDMLLAGCQRDTSFRVIAGCDIIGDDVTDELLMGMVLSDCGFFVLAFDCPEITAGGLARAFQVLRQRGRLNTGFEIYSSTLPASTYQFHVFLPYFDVEYLQRNRKMRVGNVHVDLQKTGRLTELSCFYAPLVSRITRALHHYSTAPYTAPPPKSKLERAVIPRFAF